MYKDEELYLNGSVILDTSTVDYDDLMDENGMFKEGEMCMNIEGMSVCMIVDSEGTNYTMDCSTSEFSVATYDETLASLDLSSACTNLDASGNYTSLDNEDLSCSNFICSIEINGNDYSKDCRE